MILAPMAFDMGIMLVACAAVLLIAWICDQANDPVESGRYHGLDTALRARMRPSWPHGSLKRPRLSTQRSIRPLHDSGSGWWHEPVRF
jgi:hypothetical protein